MKSMKKNLFSRVLFFYINGFKNLSSTGKKLWIIILIKLFIMFGILKLFFFNDYLGKQFSTDEEKSNHVIEQLTSPKRIK